MDTVAEVKALTAGGVDVTIECAGVPETFQTGLKMTRRGGAFVLFGVAPAGMDVAVTPFDLLVSEVDVRPAYLTHLRMNGRRPSWQAALWNSTGLSPGPSGLKTSQVSSAVRPSPVKSR